MNTPTPTPRPALKATGMRRRHARCLETELAALRARAERAEDNLAALEQCHDDNCRGVVKIADDLAAERARLDWLLLDVVSRFDDAYYTRATIDAGMREGAK